MKLDHMMNEYIEMEKGMCQIVGCSAARIKRCWSVNGLSRVWDEDKKDWHFEHVIPNNLKATCLRGSKEDEQ